MKLRGLILTLVGALALTSVGISAADACAPKRHKPVCHYVEPVPAPAPVAPPAQVKIVVVHKTVTSTPDSLTEPDFEAYAGCRKATDARLLQIYSDGQRRYWWHNWPHWFVPQPKKEGAVLCILNDVLGWWYPPEPRKTEEQPAGAADSAAPKQP